MATESCAGKKKGRGGGEEGGLRYGDRGESAGPTSH